MKRTIFFLTFFLSGCASLQTTDMEVVKAINDRLVNLETKANTTPPAVKKEEKHIGLNEAQKDFVKFMLDYLGDEKP